MTKQTLLVVKGSERVNMRNKKRVNTWPPVNFCYASLSSADFVQNHLFRKILSDIVYCTIPSEYQTVWIQIRPDILWGLIWVQTVCKGYQQTTLGGTALTILYLALFSDCF